MLYLQHWKHFSSTDRYIKQRFERHIARWHKDLNEGYPELNMESSIHSSSIDAHYLAMKQYQSEISQSSAELPSLTQRNDLQQ